MGSHCSRRRLNAKLAGAAPERQADQMNHMSYLDFGQQAASAHGNKGK